MLAANADEIDTLLTMLKLRDDWQGREMAWHLHWLLLKAETREPRRSLFKFCFAPHPAGQGEGWRCYTFGCGTIRM